MILITNAMKTKQFSTPRTPNECFTFDVCTTHFVEFYYICPKNVQYILTISVSQSTPTCSDVYTSLSGINLLGMLKLQNYHFINFVT